MCSKIVHKDIARLLMCTHDEHIVKGLQTQSSAQQLPEIQHGTSVLQLKI